MKTKVLFFILTLTAVLCSCSSEETRVDFAIEKQEIELMKYFSRTKVRITSGNKDYSIRNQNPDIVEAYVDYKDGKYGSIVIKLLKKGEATMEVTDNVCHTTLPLKVSIIDNEILLPIQESDHPLFPKKRALRLKDDEQRSFRVTNKSATETNVEGRYSVFKDEGTLHFTIGYKDEANNEVKETYDIKESDHYALQALDHVLDLGLLTTGRSGPLPQAYLLRMKGVDNAYHIECIVTADEGYEWEWEE